MSQHKQLCPSCRMRYAVTPPAARDSYNPMLMTAQEVQWLENAARLFDEIAEEDRYTAAEFVAWLRPDLNGKWAPIKEFSGIARKEGGFITGSMQTRHGSADPLPVVPMKLRKLVS